MNFMSALRSSPLQLYNLCQIVGTLTHSPSPPPAPTSQCCSQIPTCCTRSRASHYPTLNWGMKAGVPTTSDKDCSFLSPFTRSITLQLKERHSLLKAGVLFSWTYLFCYYSNVFHLRFQAILAAVVIANLIGLLRQFSRLKDLWKIHKPDAVRRILLLVKEIYIHHCLSFFLLCTFQTE